LLLLPRRYRTPDILVQSGVSMPISPIRLDDNALLWKEKVHRVVPNRSLRFVLYTEISENPSNRKFRECLLPLKLLPAITVGRYVVPLFQEVNELLVLVRNVLQEILGTITQNTGRT